MDKGAEVRRLPLEIRDADQYAAGLRQQVRRLLVHKTVTGYTCLEGTMVRDSEVSMLAQRALQALTPSLRYVSEETGLNYGTLRTWRAGIRSASPDNLRKLAEMADQQADKLRGLAVEMRRVADGTREV